MNEVDPLKQIPNLEQVFTITLVPLLFVFLLLGTILSLLWFKVRRLEWRVAALEAELRGQFQRRS
jgi:hypothetical protein